MTDNRMEHGNHKAEKPEPKPAGDRQERAPLDEPAEPRADSHKPLEEIPANEGGKGDLP